MRNSDDIDLFDMSWGDAAALPDLHCCVCDRLLATATGKRDIHGNVEFELHENVVALFSPKNDTDEPDEMSCRGCFESWGQA